MTTERRVSLVAPLQDEERTVCALLQSIAEQSHLPDEILLVDAGSRDNTVRNALAVELPRPLRILETSRVFPGVARNEGVREAQFEWIAFTDGGIVLHPHWLRELLCAATNEADVVLGDFDPVCDSLFRECAAIAYVGPRTQHGTIRGPFIASSLIRRSALLGVGGFPPYRAAEDLILLSRLQAAGARVVIAPKARVLWQIAGTLGATFRRFANYSHHNLIACWGRHWHLGIGRLYFVLALAVAGLHMLGTDILPWLALPIFFLARAAKSAWVKRLSFDFSPLHPKRVLGAAAILLVIDVATAVGLVRWLRASVPRAR